MTIDGNQAVETLLESGPSGSPTAASGVFGGFLSGLLSDDACSSTSRPLGRSLGEDPAQFSGAQWQVQAFEEQALQLPEIRQEKVDALRPVVLGGNYQIDSKHLAEAMFAHLLVTPAACPGRLGMRGLRGMRGMGER
jgi:flagellar biosynthesis anti-sigma factor FlgM